jgi:hypothetical protein
LDRAARQPRRRQYAAAERVNPPPATYRSDSGDRARERARACGFPDPDSVTWVRFGLNGIKFAYTDDRDPVLLAPLTAS